MKDINYQIPPEAHTPMYSWHKFWGRKTWNVVSRFVETYSPEGGIVMDPFSGSGVTALEALKLGRRVIAVDLVPIATEILRLTIQNVDPLKLREAFERVERDVKKTISDFYLAECRKCGQQIAIQCAVWKRDEKKRLTLKELRYKCPNCREVVEKGGAPKPKDLKHLRGVEEEFGQRRLWYPRNRLYYPDGNPFKEKQQYDSVDEMFTPRNLYALALLIRSIEREKDDRLRDFLKICFTSMVHLCSTLGAVSDPLPTSHHTPFSSTGWTQHSYWFAREFMEQNVWIKFESAMLGHQGLLKAKVESNQHFKNVRIGTRVEQVLDGKADICIVNASCLDVFEKMSAKSVDYIFTDPPYDASIQYGELAYMWVAWLKKDKGYVQKIWTDEIVRNERQQKNFEVYHTLLRKSFDQMYRVLKLNRHLTLTFHNPTFKVRNATIRAGTQVGFEFEKIHHQPTAQKSGKSLLQPFGSATGDFYLRFHKPASEKARKEGPEEIDETRFEKIAIDTTVQLLAERAEPTPYTIIINYIDPVLARHGYFSTLHTGLDVSAVLKKHIGKEFRLVAERIGGVKGQLWWFNDPKVVSRLTEIPLSERVEQTVYRLLLAEGRITFTDAWERVSVEFPNSLTSDSTSIREALEQYARPISGGYWLLKPQINQRVNQHNEIIAVLAEVGQEMGHQVWIGKKEQSEYARGIIGSDKSLKSYVSANLTRLREVKDLATVERIDLIWIRDSRVVAAFEVESTTTMTSGLVRGSNLPSEAPKYLVIPEERDDQLKRKMKSPMFAERFLEDHWSVLYFDTLRANYKKLKACKVAIQDLVDAKMKVNAVKEAQQEYTLFSEQEMDK
jgi:16S rRNA G966 N2-methylase RsmD